MQQYAAQLEMQHLLNDEEADFENIILSISDYQNSKVKKDEIAVNGNMYDVKSSEIIGDSINLLVINDKKEKKIVERINDFTNNSEKSKSNTTNQIKSIEIFFLDNRNNAKPGDIRNKLLIVYDQMSQPCQFGADYFNDKNYLITTGNKHKATSKYKNYTFINNIQ